MGGPVCAVHIRRNDVYQQQYSERFVPLWDYFVLIEKLRHKFTCCIHVFTDGTRYDTKPLAESDPLIIFHIRADLLQTFQSLVEADVLVLGKSDFSTLAGILSNGVVINNFALRSFSLSGWIRL